MLVFSVWLVMIAVVSVMFLYWTRLRLLNAVVHAAAPPPRTERYQPMLRLLAQEELDFVKQNPYLGRTIRARRRELFRGYLRCLTKDYAMLLAGIRAVMVESGVDRPDLAKALAKNRMMFALALCRIELHLQLHALGIGRVDVSALVSALDALRQAAALMTTSAQPAY